MERNYSTKMVYRVWYGKGIEKEAFFTEKETAEAFTKLVNGNMNIYKWEMKIEK